MHIRGRLKERIATFSNNLHRQKTEIFRSKILQKNNRFCNFSQQNSTFFGFFAKICCEKLHFFADGGCLKNLQSVLSDSSLYFFDFGQNYNLLRIVDRIREILQHVSFISSQFVPTRKAFSRNSADF